MTTRVDLPKSKYHKIQFPQVCPVCGSQQPDTHVKLSSYFAIYKPLREPLGLTWPLSIPICTEHKYTLKITRVISVAFFMLMIVLSMLIFYAIWLLTHPMHWGFYTIIGILCLSLAIYLHDKIYKAPLLYSTYANRLLLTFKDDQLAEQFAELNGIEQVYDSMNQPRKIPSK